MKRSQINSYIQEAILFFDKFFIKLPPWAYYNPEEWSKKGKECTEIKDHMLGWDLTDFGSDQFEKKGLLLFTLRNGSNSGTGNQKTYAEKIMIVRDKQVTPTHFHWKKMEDIINRGGGRLCIQLWKSDAQEALSLESFTVQVDGVTVPVNAGDVIKLKPGESICLEPYVYHKFWAENGMTIVGEVSMVNDDKTDNRFLEPVGRFPEIQEDESAAFMLCTEYPSW